ncbi:MAG: multicopper oxidase domain-containing protein, partial [Gemmatimonadota bacterium]
FVRLLDRLLLAPAIHGQTLLAPGVEAISANDNRVAAGRLEAGILSLELEVREGRWTVGDDHGPSAVVQAFAERGAPLSIPGPLIRVREGTRLHVTVHNPLADSLVLYGLHRRPGSREDAVRVAPGESRTVEFEAGAPGSYYYWATTTGVTKLDERESIDSQLYGALIVDPADAPDVPRDRIFVLGVWFAPADSTEPEPLAERIEAALGDTLRWRVLNPTRAPHPMHLHGVYYNVVSQGSWAADTLYAPEQRRLVVTELMIQGSTMAMEWVAAIHVR